MTKNEKIILIQSLLKSLVSLPNNSWLSILEAKNIFQNISITHNESIIDDYIVILTETLEKIWFKIKNVNNKVNKMIISDNEVFEKDLEQQDINNLFSNF